MEGKALIMDEKAMSRAINRISYEIIERNKGSEGLCVIGIYSRGVELAQRIAGKIQSVEQRPVPAGCLDITPFRDDGKKFDGISHTDIPFPLDNKQVILVDDVICTGRSVRAAIDGILSIGRPAESSSLSSSTAATANSSCALILSGKMSRLHGMRRSAFLSRNGMAKTVSSSVNLSNCPQRRKL